MSSRISLSLVSHTNVGKTSLARTLLGRDVGEVRDGFPRLAGLDAGYVVNQMRAFRTPLRKHGVIMKNETRALTDAQMRAVAAYVQSR